jgi:hypothetical protein
LAWRGVPAGRIIVNAAVPHVLTHSKGCLHKSPTSCRGAGRD